MPSASPAARLQPPGIGASLPPIGLSFAPPPGGAPPAGALPPAGGLPPPGGSQPPAQGSSTAPPPQQGGATNQAAPAQGTTPQQGAQQNAGPAGGQNPPPQQIGDLRPGDPIGDPRRADALARISSTSRTDWIVGDQSLATSAKATGDERLSKLVNDVVGLLGSVRQGNGRFEPKPFGGKSTVILPSLLTYQSSAAAAPNARGVGQAIEKSPALFGDLGF